MEQVPSTSALSQGDEYILNQVFDPESSPETPTIVIDSLLAEDSHIKDVQLLKELKRRELNAIQLVEQHSQKPHLSGFNSIPDELDTDKDNVFAQSLEILSNLIKDYPEYASAYNNRAQLRRWRFGDVLLSANNSPDIELALESVISDLKEAIRLATPSRLKASISPAQSKLLIQAWTQLGAVYWSLGRHKKDSTSAAKPIKAGAQIPYLTASCKAEDWLWWSGSRLEEEGSRCFYQAGLYGSDVGRSLAVKTNPYARLCSGIVKEAIRREQNVVSL